MLDWKFTVNDGTRDMNCLALIDSSVFFKFMSSLVG